MRRKLIIELIVSGPDAGDAERGIDSVLDGGAVQDAINEALSDRGMDAEITSALCFDGGELPDMQTCGRCGDEFTGEDCACRT